VLPLTGVAPERERWARLVGPRPPRDPLLARRCLRALQRALDALCDRGPEFNTSISLSGPRDDAPRPEHGRHFPIVDSPARPAHRTLRPVGGRGRMGGAGIGLCALALLGVGCGSSTSSAATDAAVIAGWKAAFRAVDSASLTANANSPALPATFVQPELGIVKHNLSAERAAHTVATGRDTVLWAHVIYHVGNQASIRACIRGQEIVVDANTRQPVSGSLGQRGIEGVAATLILEMSEWKVQRQSVKQGHCEK
jgi:hypothetical protein